MKIYKCNEAAAKKHANLLVNYGITLYRYARMLARQSNACFICGVGFDSSLKSRRPQVDHCHITFRIRKLLCAGCNLKVASVEANKSECRHIKRRFDKMPYRQYLRDHGCTLPWIVADVNIGE